MCANFQAKRTFFYFFWPKFSQKLILESEFQKQCLQDSESDSEPPRYHVCQFLVRTDNFEFFGLNLGKLSNYMQYIIVLITLRVLQRAGWRCVEVDGAGWRWVHGLAIPVLILVFILVFILISVHHHRLVKHLI